MLTDDASIRELNRRFRHKDKATDVLSFPAASEGQSPGRRIAGDLAISLDLAAAQAGRFGHSLDVEVRILMLHGLLHLAGWDHEADHGEMAAREQELRGELDLPMALIERAASAALDVRPRSGASHGSAARMSGASRRRQAR